MKPPESFHLPDPRPAEPVARVRRDGERVATERPVANEVRLEVFVNERRLLAFNCSAVKLNEMVTGYLWLEQLIESVDDIDLLRVCREDRLVEVTLAKPVDFADYERRRALTSGCGGGTTFQDLMEARRIEPVNGGPVVTARQLFDWQAELYQGSAWYRASGGLHAAALACPERGILVLCEDLGRHNTIDKVVGECLLGGIDPAGKVLLSTGRMSSDMVLKAGRMRVPILASRTSPTDLSVELAREFGLTLVGYIRGPDCYLYTGAERVARSLG